MSTTDSADLKATFDAFSTQATLEILLPPYTTGNLEDALTKLSPTDLIQSRSRHNVFFDEKCMIFLALKTSSSQTDIQHLLPSLEISLAAHATDAVPSGTGNAASASGKHDLVSTQFAASEAAVVRSTEESTFVFWQLTLLLPRPRVRLQRPAVYFTTTLEVTRAALSAAQRPRTDSVKSFEPQSRNLLEPLRFDPAFHDTEVHLSESRVLKTTPIAPSLRGDLKTLRGASKRAFPIVPALFSRIRYSSLPDATIASLHLETSQVGCVEVSTESVHLDVPDAVVDDLSKLALPLRTRGGDEIVMLRRLTRLADVPENDKSVVTVNIQATAVTAEDGDVPLSSSWQSYVNLSHIGPKPVYKWISPQVAALQHTARAGVDSAVRPGSSGIDQMPMSSHEEQSVVFNFSAPATTRRNADFAIGVQCINSSSKPRQFVLVNMRARRVRRRDTLSTEPDKTTAVADMLSELPLDRRKAPDILDLNPDLRIGPLQPGASYEAAMRMRALVSGALDLGAVRIIDLDTRHTVDIRQLPDVVSLDSPA